MRQILNPNWIFIINTLPSIALFILSFGQFKIIKSLIDPSDLKIWISFGILLSFFALVNIIYAFALRYHNKTVHTLYGFLLLATYIPYMIYYGMNSYKFYSNVPNWMLSDDLITYIGAFLMPTLAYGFFILVTRFTPTVKDHAAWKSALYAISIPILWYVFFQGIFPLWQGHVSFQVIMILGVVTALFSIFFFVRSIYILVTKKGEKWKKLKWLWLIPSCFLFPILGLTINNGHFPIEVLRGDLFFFGDFSNHWFYILTIINGILLCLPNLENKEYRMILFIGRSITFMYTFYFFIILLPFIPISIFSLLLFGLGFLLLAPIFLFVVHVSQLSKDTDYLKQAYPKWKVKIAMAVGIITLPFFITMQYQSDKTNLHQALEYAYSPDYSKVYNIESKHLEKTLNRIKRNKRRNNAMNSESHKPYLSRYYKWIVLDNLTLSNEKINYLEQIFLGKEKISESPWARNTQSSHAEISDISSTSTFDSEQNCWKSWIDIELSNPLNQNSVEYSTIIDLPEGAWIGDYYLYVEGVKEMGMLSEKKAALWVYKNIRNRNRDPGILYYLTGNKVAFKVFPFNQKQVRKTGIEIIHKTPIILDIDDYYLHLGKAELNYPSQTKNPHAYFVTAQEKATLKKIKRTPYYHFVVDATSREKMSHYEDKIHKFLSNKNNEIKPSKISFTDNRIHEVSFNQKWDISEIDPNGGFFVDRAIKKILYTAHQKQESSFPIIVVVSDSFSNSILDKDFADWQFAVPELDMFYELTEENHLIPHSLITNPMIRLNDTISTIENKEVLIYEKEGGSTHYLPDNQEASIVLKSKKIQLQDVDVSEHNWNSGLSMQAQWQFNILHPSSTGDTWLDMVATSFRSKIMSPVTSYMVVENEAQKAALLKKQKQVLNGNKHLDTDEDTRSMSEPNFWVVTIILFFFIIYRNKNLIQL